MESKAVIRGDHMKIRTILLTLAAVFAAAVLCFAADVNIGTWKVNAAKSQNLPSDEKNTTIAIVAAGDSMKVTFDGSDDKGKPTHNEWTGKFDGKDYPMTGDPDIDTLAYKPINDHTQAVMVKKGVKLSKPIASCTLLTVKPAPSRKPEVMPMARKPRTPSFTTSSSRQIWLTALV
jgi:hypothetical protein